MQARTGKEVCGIDISHYQGNVDFVKVKNSGKQFVYIKSSEGIDYVDPMLDTYVKGAKAAGLPFGLYHFSRPDLNKDPIAEANHFISLLKQYQPDLTAVCDLEEPTNASTMTGAQLSQWTRTFYNTIVSAGFKMILYTGNWFIERFNLTGLSDIPLWISNYGSISAPPDDGGWSNWIMWQYASDGKVDGINGNVDMDIAISLDALRSGQMYQTVKVQINGKPWMDGLFINGSTYVVWTALNEFGTPNQYKGNGLFVINGQNVQGIVYNGSTYLPWRSLAPNIQYTEISGGYNFTIKQPQPSTPSPSPTPSQTTLDKDAAQKVLDFISKTWFLTGDTKIQDVLHFANDAIRKEIGS